MCPYTLHHNKMLASTMQHSTNNHTPPRQPPPPTPAGVRRSAAETARKNTTPHNNRRPRCLLRTQQRAKPTFLPYRSALVPPSHPHPQPTKRQTSGCETGVNFPVKGEKLPTTRGLLRKEVIQPHLPVRLPCYDFVLIASPTFDHSPPYGLGHGLRVLPTFMT